MRTDPQQFTKLLEKLPQNINVAFIPLVENSKEPNVPKGVKIKECLDEIKLSKDEALSRIQRGLNVGIYAFPQGLCFVDIDRPDLIDISELPESFTVKTRNGGYQIYYQNPGIERNYILKLDGQKIGELRANWQYVVAPGSYVPPDEEKFEGATGLYEVIKDVEIIDLDFEAIRKFIEEEPKTEQKTKPKEKIANHNLVFVNKYDIGLDTILEVDEKLRELLNDLNPGYPSRSEADLATIDRLWYWGFDEHQIADILRTYRSYEKTERDDYLYHTIEKAVASFTGERFSPTKNPQLFIKLCNIQNGSGLNGAYYVNREKNIPSKPWNTWNTWNAENAKNTESYNIKKSLFEPDCVQRARGTPNLDALKLILAWQKKKKVPEDKRAEFIDSFIAAHGLNPTTSEYTELWKIPEFSCDYAEELGLCVGENCKLRLPPADRLILDTESVIIFHSSGEMDVKVAGRRKIIPLKRFFKKVKSESVINTAIFDEIFLECYLLPANPPFSEEEAFRVYQSWLEIADHVKTPVDTESGLEETIIEILTTKRDYYSFDLLKEKKVPPKRGFFVEDGIIYVESGLLKELIEESGVKYQREKLARAAQRILAGKVKRIRIGENSRYFWRFNLQAIQAILRREGDEWEPEVIEDIESSEIAELIPAGGDEGWRI
ncbi:MAG: bifunctional DNA primase/polymerase [Archaeoglobus sp.]|uniref:bifunctional DNA primase/polymerase n=1 Tax=Archaeoglobus sp. TaxID=1872626 RepID=UPI001D4624B1|nr:bifunctional DNA primase/polymerase [Archaeoglobus sp.]MBO8180668.1 bifunctional DNA primase/polymerase [Archaeoglobus sp.]